MKTVVEIAREADLKSNKGGPYRIDPETGAWLERFAEIVRADEREACALVSEDCGAIHVAKRIRARGDT